mgnify:CR=1 FL=1
MNSNDSTKNKRRYTPEEKQSVLDFIAERKTQNKRGAQKEAAERFGISTVTISSWMKATKAKRGRKPAAKTTAEKKTSTRRSTAKKAEGPKKPTALIIMDGFGHREETKGNAIEAAKKPNLDKIFAENPLTYIGLAPEFVDRVEAEFGEKANS